MTHALQQNYANSCGAVCLLCAALELGVEHLPALQGRLAWNGQSLACTMACETALYGATSSSDVLGLDLRDAGYSYPPYVINAARLLGLDGAVYVDPNVVSQLLMWGYGKVVSQCRGAGIQVHDAAVPALGQDQRELKIVVVGAKPLRFLPGIPVGLHYVLVRPDGSVMDPASGHDHTSFPALRRTLPEDLKADYHATGISIVIGPG